MMKYKHSKMALIPIVKADAIVLLWMESFAFPIHYEPNKLLIYYLHNKYTWWLYFNDNKYINSISLLKVEHIKLVFFIILSSLINGVVSECICLRFICYLTWIDLGLSRLVLHTRSIILRLRSWIYISNWLIINDLRLIVCDLGLTVCK